MTDEELIAYLRLQGLDKDVAAADRIEALVKELATSNEVGRAFEEDAGQQRARAERLEAAMIQMRDDKTGFRHAVHFRRFITAALKGADQ